MYVKRERERNEEREGKIKRMKHIIHMTGGVTEFFTVASVPGSTPDRMKD